MKKILLSAAAVFAAMSLNAQEICTFNPDNVLNLDADNGSALTAGTIIGETESIIATIGADDSYKPQDVASIINGVESKGGLQGSTNPKDADGGTPSSTLVQPASGAYLQFEAKADGFLYVIHKASSNKAYTVFEEGTAISYTFAAIGDAACDLGAVYEFTLPYEVENEQFVVKNPIEWAEREYLKAAKPDVYASRLTTDADGKEVWSGDDLKKGGIGVIKFPVYKDCKYIVNANGSKITAGGFVFSKEDNVLIQSGDVVIYKGEGAAEPVKKVYSVIGTLVGNWDVDTDMELVNGLYTATIEIANAGSYEYKIRQDHEWAINWGDNGDGTGVQDGPNFKAELPANSSITITFDPATAKIDAYVAGGALPEPGGDVDIWVSDGSKGAISWSSDYRFASDEKKTGEEIYAVPMDVWEKMKTTPFFLDLEGENPQIRVTTGWWDSDATYTGNDITPGSELLTDNGDGKWTLKVDLSATQALLDLVDDHHLLFTGDRYTPVKLYFSDTTAIKTVKAAKKFNGAIYNLAGQKVNASYKSVVIKDGKKYIQK